MGFENPIIFFTLKQLDGVKVFSKKLIHRFFQG